MEEVREVGGELYSKLSLVDRTIIQPITNTKNNYTTQVVLRWGTNSRHLQSALMTNN